MSRKKVNVILSGFILFLFTACSSSNKETSGQVSQSSSKSASNTTASAKTDTYPISEFKGMEHRSLTPDGKTAYFYKDENMFCTIMVSDFENEKWSTPRVADFSGKYFDETVFVSPDGNKIFFVSMRPIADGSEGVRHLWMVEKNSSGWSDPKNLKELNTMAGEMTPTVTTDGTLYFENEGNIWKCKYVNGVYVKPEKLSNAINTNEYIEYAPWIAPDESYLIFGSSGRPDSIGLEDIYISINKNGVWQNARLLGNGINSPSGEYGGHSSPDGKYFYFYSGRDGGSPDSPFSKTFKIDIKALELENNK